MKYDFDAPTDRRNSNSYKWDSGKYQDMIPLWVADMDFKTAPAIIDALRQKVDSGIFGYTFVPDDYYDAVTGWFLSRHGWQFRKEDIIYTTGVVPAISAVIKALTKPGDKVIVQTPVYNCFFSSIRNNDCVLSENPLIYKDLTYFIDFEDLEKKASDPETKLLLLCNPHNPAGRVWSEEELTRIGEICRKNSVTVVSDEIHCELVYPPYRYIPFASVKDFAKDSVSCISASKAFNIAGLQIANIVCRDEEMRKKIDKAININEVCDVNPFGVLGTIAAYTKGEEWLKDLIAYLKGNYVALMEFFKQELPSLPVLKLEGTYLVWVDCRGLGMKSEALEEYLLEHNRVWLNSGDMYGAAGEGFMRINIATQRQRLLEGLRRFKAGVESLSR